MLGGARSGGETGGPFWGLPGLLEVAGERFLPGMAAPEEAIRRRCR